MSVKAIFFDLDGTLLPMDEKKFVQVYFHLLYTFVKDKGYDDEGKLVQTIWEGTAAMMKNNGSKTNEQAFWDVFASVYGADRLKDRPLFDLFYATEFQKTAACCEKNPLARSIVDYAKAHFDHVVLATNPIFPKIATKTRMSFVGLSEEDFDLVTTYENTCHAKPNPAYFQDLLHRFDLRPEEVVLFGNNDFEDGDCAGALRIPCLLIEGHIIHDKHAKGTYKTLNMDQVIPTLESFLTK